jgi:transcriptional regulator of arginine metabolism
MDRLQTLKEILSEGSASTQDEIREALLRKRYSVTQSTISRDLKRVGALKTVDAEGRTVYRLGDEFAASPAVPAPVANSMNELVKDVRSNGTLIVIHTSPGSASLVARHLDSQFAAEIMGTIAGDDTIFVAPSDTRKTSATLAAIRRALLGEAS